MLAFRFANGMFEPLWNRNYIDHVQITAAEDIGIGSRAGYYDHAGALRDLVQNHMLQLLCHVAMEPPVNFTAEEVRNEKVKVLQAIHAPTPRHDRRRWRCARSTRPGHAGGEDVPGYLEEEGVRDGLEHRDLRGAAPGGRQLALGGRALLPARGQAPGAQDHRDRGHAQAGPAPRLQPGGLARASPNQLILTLQPNEGVSLQLGAKIPGTRMIIRPVNMEFLYGTAFLSQSPEAYERLIMDAMRGDPTLFTRNDEVEAQWQICDPIVNAWASRTGAAAAVRGRLAGTARARHPRRPELARDLTGRRRWRAIWPSAAGDRSSDAGAATRLERAGHDAGRDRSRAARAAGRAPRRERRLRAGARAEHDRVRRSRLERRDRQPPARRGALPRLAPGRALLRARAASAWTRARRSPPRAIRDPASWRCCARRWSSSSASATSTTSQTIADPLVVTDLPTLLWSPHGHHEIVDALLGLAQAVLLDSVDEPELARGDRARARAVQRRVRRGPRVAALDPVARADRDDLRPARDAPRAARDRGRHDPPPPRVGDRGDAAGRLAGLAPAAGRLRRRCVRARTARSRGTATRGAARTSRCACRPPPSCRCAASRAWSCRPPPGARCAWTAGPAACTRTGRDARGSEREWTILGASRGEGGILGEGIRQALLRDPTYAPALAAAAQTGAVTRLRPTVSPIPTSGRGARGAARSRDALRDALERRGAAHLAPAGWHHAAARATSCSRGC